MMGITCETIVSSGSNRLNAGGLVQDTTVKRANLLFPQLRYRATICSTIGKGISHHILLNTVKKTILFKTYSVLFFTLFLSRRFSWKRIDYMHAELFKRVKEQL